MLTGNIAGGSRPDVMCPLLALVSLASLVGCALLVTDFSSLQRVDQLPRSTLCKKEFYGSRCERRAVFIPVTTFANAISFNALLP